MKVGHFSFLGISLTGWRRAIIRQGQESDDDDDDDESYGRCTSKSRARHPCTQQTGTWYSCSAAIEQTLTLTPADVISEKWSCSHPGYYWFALTIRRGMYSISISVNSFAKTLFSGPDLSCSFEWVVVFTASGLMICHSQWGAATVEPGVFVHCMHVKRLTSLHSKQRTNSKQINCRVIQIKVTSGANYCQTCFFISLLICCCSFVKKLS